MAEKKLSIDIGERIIRVCTAGNKHSLLPTKSFLFATPAGAVSDGQLNDPTAIAEALRAELSKRGVKQRSATFALSSGKVAVREISLPPVKETRLKELIENNASDYFPVDMSKYHITYTVLDRETKENDNGYRVLVLAAPLNILEGYFKLAEAAGLQVAAIDYSGNSQFRMLENRCGDEVTMCVNIGTNATNISFMKGKKHMLNRVLATGGEEYILTYMHSAGKTEEKYLEALHELTRGDIDAVRRVMSEGEIKESLSRLVSNIVRTAEYFNSNNWATPVERFVLFGSCGNLAGLSEALSEAVSLPVTRLDALPGFKELSGDALDTVSTYFNCAGSVIKPVELIPPQFVKGKSKKRAKSESLKSAVALLVLCILVSGAISAVSVMNYLTAKQDKADMERKIADFEYTEQKYLAYVDYQNGAADFVTLDAITNSPNDALVEFIEELEKEMPKQIRVLSAVCSTTGVDMNVVVDTKEQAAKVIVQLRGFESIDTVSVGAVAETTDDTGVTIVSFALSCLYKDTSPNPETVLQPTEAEPTEAEPTD